MPQINASASTMFTPLTIKLTFARLRTSSGVLLAYAPLKALTANPTAPNQQNHHKNKPKVQAVNPKK